MLVCVHRLLEGQSSFSVRFGGSSRSPPLPIQTTDSTAIVLVAVDGGGAVLHNASAALTHSLAMVGSWSWS